MKQYLQEIMMKSYEVVEKAKDGSEIVIAVYTSKQVALARAKELQTSCHEKSIKYIVKESL